MSKKCWICLENIITIIVGFGDIRDVWWANNFSYTPLSISSIFHYKKMAARQSGEEMMIGFEEITIYVFSFLIKQILLFNFSAIGQI